MAVDGKRIRVKGTPQREERLKKMENVLLIGKRGVYQAIYCQRDVRVLFGKNILAEGKER